MSSRNQRSYHRLAQKAPRLAADGSMAPFGGDAPKPVTIGGERPWRVLVAASQPDVVADATYHLANLGLRVTTALTGPEVVTAVRLQRPDLIVLGSDLPEVDGLEIVRRLRVVPESSYIAVIVLLRPSRDGDDAAAIRTSRMQALAVGADDCVSIPFEPRELVLRARTILRRFTRLLPGVDDVVVLENVTLNVGSQEVVVDEQPLELTPREFLLLRSFLTHPDRLFTRRELHERLWMGRKPMSGRAIDMHVHRLRQKLGAAHLQIETIASAGYLIRPRPRKRAPSVRGRRRSP